jgi:Glycosyltransferase family 87
MERSQNQKRTGNLMLACALLGAWGWMFLGPLYLRVLAQPRNEVTDFYQDWGSARNHQAGLPVYLSHSTSIPIHLGLPGNPVKSIEYNSHPPGTVLFMLPLASLSYAHALWLWNIVSLAAFVASLAIVAVTLPVPRAWFWPTWAFLPFCQPLFADLHLGQLTLILLFLITSAWALNRSGRQVAAGTLLGLAASIKLFPAYMLIYFLAKGRIQTVIAVTLAFVAWNGLAACVLGIDSYRDYMTVVLPRMEAFRGYGYNLSIAGFWYKLFNPATDQSLPLWYSPALARIGSLASILIITAVVALQTFRPFPQRSSPCCSPHPSPGSTLFSCSCYHWPCWPGKLAVLAELAQDRSRW